MSSFSHNESVERGRVQVEIESGPAASHRPSVISRNWTGPRTITVPRDHDGYGFTLRYFVVYPPPSIYKEENADDEDDRWDDFDENEDVDETRPEPLDTFFVKNVAPGGAAASAGLCEGDRIVSINGNLIGGKSYKDVVELIQSCVGDLKIGVVPRDEDILQLAYQEYVYDGASLGYTAGLEQIAQDFDMQQPSVNKWATPIISSRRTSIEENGSDSGKSKLSKYDPCVSFAAGAPIIKQDAKYAVFVNQNQTNSTSSSGKSTPGARSSGSATPPYRVTKKIDPCVTFVAGKPILTPPSESDERVRPPDFSRGAVNPLSLKKALKQSFPEEQNKEESNTRKGRVIIKQHFDKDELEVAPSTQIERGKFYGTDGNKKSSAISVLREDFRVPVPKTGVRNIQQNMVTHEGAKDGTFHLSVSLAENEHSKPHATVTYSRDLITRGQRGKITGNLTSLTSQATLVESNNNSNERSTFDRNQPARRGMRSNSREMLLRKDNRSEEKRNNKIGFVVATKEPSSQKQKISSSSDISDDDSAVENGKDADVLSADDDPDTFTGKSSRRVSYLIATATSPTMRLPHKLSDISNPEADDEDSDTFNRQCSQESVEADADDMKLLPIAKEGWLNKKLVQSADRRRRASSRTWKSLYTVLRGHYLYCYKDKIELEGSSYDDEQMQILNLKGSVVDIAHDYAKRKHVFRLATVTGSEYLFQAQDTQSLMAWVNALRDSNPEKDSNGNSYENVIVKRMKSYEGETNPPSTSPPGTTKTNNSKRGLSLKKTHFTLGYKNTKKRGLVNIHISHSKDKEVQATGFTFGLPLEKCPRGKDNEFVPVIIEHCCKVVEAKGLDYLGIYRVPGNAAAVQLLQEELDSKEPESINFEEEKWHDLNNIGSLLKSFLRKLPEPLIPKDMYSKFIDANREEDSNERLKSLRLLIRNLPDYHYQTLQFLIKHLRMIADHSEKNKMEPKNLAIVFGPTVVRTSDENMVSMVKDMSDQCRIIETLIHQAEWIYADDDGIECTTQEVVKNDSEGGRPYVASKGLLESLGQMAENYDGEQPVKAAVSKDPKDKQGVASAIMSLTNFTSGISLKLRNKAMSPVFPKRNGKQEQNTSPESENIPCGQNDDGGNSTSNLRRLASEPEILSTDMISNSRPVYNSEGENEEDLVRVKSKIKSKYNRAVQLGTAGSAPSNRANPKPPKSESRKNSTERERQPVYNNNGANITLQIPFRAEVTVREGGRKDQSSEAYRAAMLSEKTRLRLQQVSVEHQAASEKRQIEKEKIDKEREKTIRDLRQEEDDSFGDEGFPSNVRDSDDTVSCTSDSNSSSRKESLDSLSSPIAPRKYQISSRRTSENSNSEGKPSVYTLTPAEMEQREREKKQLDLFLGQFEVSDEDVKSSISDCVPSPENLAPPRSITTVDNLGAKSLDEKLRILLDPNFQEKDGKLVRRNLSSSSSNSTTSPIDSVDFSRSYNYSGSSKKADFAASIRGLDKPLKTKVIGLSATKLSMPVYTPDMAARFDNFKQKKQELEKKVSNILQDTTKSKSIYDNECNKTDEQKVASLRQKSHFSQPQKAAGPTQRVIVSASDISQFPPHRSIPHQMPPANYENLSRQNIESSLKRLDRNVQQVVELLQESQMGESSNESHELATLLNNLQRQAMPENDYNSTNISARYPLKKSGPDERNANYQVASKRGDISSAKSVIPGKGDLVRVQQWRTGQDQTKHEYNKFYPR